MYRGTGLRNSTGGFAGRSVAGFIRTTTHALRLALLLILPITGAAAAAAFAAEPADLRAASSPAGPVFRLDEFRGKGTLSLAGQHGKIVLLHFFATYCEPCRPEMASLNRFLQANAGKPFSVFAVDVGEIDLRVRAFFEKEPVDFPIVLDRDRKVAKAWGVSALPTTIVLDEKLQPKLIVEGDLDWSHPTVLQKLETLLPERSPASHAGG